MGCCRCNLRSPTEAHNPNRFFCVKRGFSLPPRRAVHPRLYAQLVGTGAPPVRRGLGLLPDTYDSHRRRAQTGSRWHYYTLRRRGRCVGAGHPFMRAIPCRVGDCRWESSLATHRSFEAPHGKRRSSLTRRSKSLVRASWCICSPALSYGEPLFDSFRREDHQYSSVSTRGKAAC